MKLLFRPRRLALARQPNLDQTFYVSSKTVLYNSLIALFSNRQVIQSDVTDSWHYKFMIYV